MLNSIIRFSIRNKLVIGLLTIALVILGIVDFQRLPIDAVPDITDNQVQVITVSPALGAPDIERLITYPIEQATGNIPGIKEIRSFSRFGLSLVTIVFTDETDVYWARQQVAERLNQVQRIIPPELGTPELAPVTTGLGEIYQYVLRPAPGYEQRYDEVELRTIQDWIVRRQLLGVKGVADVSGFGGKLKQYEVAVDAARLQSHGLGMQDVLEALERNNGNTGGAYIEKGPAVLFIRTEGLVSSLEDIGRIAVKQMSNGQALLLKDVAEVRFGTATRYGAMLYNDEGEVSGGIVMMLKGANSSEVISLVKERIAQIRETLPEGVILEPFLDRTKMVDNAIGTVEKNLLEGALIVLFILVLFLGQLRAGLIVASVIPLSMLFAIIMMNIFGVSGNLMSLGALDFGLIVDGAVIIVEAIMHRLLLRSSGGGVSILSKNEMDQEVTTSSSRMMNSAVFGQLIILIVYLPIFMLEGIEGKMFKPMAQTVAFALLGAFLLSITYIPMMSSLLLSRKTTHKRNISDRMMDFISRRFASILEPAIRRPLIVIGSTIMAFVLSIFLLMNLGGEFMPELEEGDLAVDTRVLTGSNLETTIKATSEAAGLLKSKFPEVIKVVTKIGSGEIPTDPMPIEASDMMVILKDKKEWTSAETFDELTTKMSEELKVIPGITAGFQYPVQMRFNELMTGARQDVVCKIFGEDLDTLTHYAARLGQLVNTVDGACDLYVESMTGMPQIVITYDRSALARYGVDVQEVNRVVNTAFAGQSTGQVFEAERRFDLVVRLSGALHRNVEDVRNLPVPTHSGIQVPLYQLAEVEVKDGPNQIQREDAKRRITVGFNVRGRDVQSIVDELERKVSKGLDLPAGYYVTYGGAFENLVEAKERLSIAVPLALALIFLLLYFAFGSVGQGLLIFTAIPLSAIGGILALALRGMPFSISAGIGFIALFGVAVLNGIVLLAEFNRLRQSGITDPLEIVRKGTLLRLRPVLMTAAVASFGFLPMALSHGAGAEVQRPLATVVIGGLISATFLTLILVPILYVFRMKWLNRRSGGLAAFITGAALMTGTTEAQTPITLQAALDSALNHPAVKARLLEADYLVKLRATSWEPGATMVNGEFGQMNSINRDTRLSVSQQFELPFTYIRKSRMYGEEGMAAGYRADEEKLRIREKVWTSFAALDACRQQIELLREADSVYALFAERTARLVQAGAATSTEEVMSKLQKGEWQMAYRAQEAEWQHRLGELQLLLQTKQDLIPQLEGFSPETQLEAGVDASGLSTHPLLMAGKADEKAARARTELERAKGWPGLSVGYFNQSLTGWQRIGDNDRYFDSGKRFDGLMVGMNIPLFYNFRTAKVKAAKVEEAIALQQTRLHEEELNLRYQEVRAQLLPLQEQYRWYKETGLPGARTIAAQAAQRLEAGDISYLEWTMLMSKSIEVRKQYIDTQHRLRMALIQLNTLNGKIR